MRRSVADGILLDGTRRAQKNRSAALRLITMLRRLEPMPTPLSCALLACGALLLAMATRLALTPWLGDRHALGLVVPMAALVSWVCGVRWALAMAAMAVVWVSLPWLPPNWYDAPDEPLATQLLSIALLAAAAFSGALRRHSPDTLPAQAAQSPRLRATERALWLSASLALVLPLVLLAALSVSGREAMTSATTQSAESALRVAAEHVQRLMQANELLARQVQSAAARNLSGASLHRLLAELARTRPHVNSLWLLGSDGYPQASSLRPDVPRIDYSDREYFTFHRDNRDQVYVSSLLMSRSTQELLFDVSMRRETADGTFNGVVNVTLKPDYFDNFFRELTTERPALTVQLMRNGGELLVRWPRPATLGERAAAPLVEAMQRQASGWLSMPQRGDRTEDFALQPLTPYGLVVAVSLDRNAMLQRWREQTSAVGATTLFAAFALLATLWIAWRRALDGWRALERLAEETEQRRSAEAQLRQSQKMEALGQLTGSVAHDFNNLLGVMQNHIALLAHRHGAAIGENALQAMQRAVHSGEHLTRKLLSFSRRRGLAPQRVDLAQALPAMREMLHMTLGSAAALEIQVVPGTPPVHTDPAEFELALINLVSNARAALDTRGGMTHGRVLVVARPAAAQEVQACAPRLAGRAVVFVSVSDNGGGMNAATLSRAREPFFTTKGEGQGTGLGLAQVENLCEHAQGALTLASEPDAGTTVSLYLPAHSDAADAQRSEDAALAHEPALQGCVLVVDDHRELAHATAALLEALGAHASIAGDAHAAQRALARSDYDAVLSDVVLPGSDDGVALATTLRRTHPALPVLLTTGHSTQVAAAEAAGFTVLHKPVPPQVLAAALAHALRRGTAKA
jgi:signal transduction histidine kinase/CheY-like chemotaxis protein